METATRDEAYRKGRTALLLVDMQRIFLLPGRDPHHPDWTAEHPFYRRVADVVLPNTARLVAASRAAGAEVLYTIIQSLTRDGRDRSLDHKLSDIHVPPGHPEAGMPDEIAPWSDEIVLPKTSSGVFNSTNIDYILRNLDVRYLLVAGALTDQCVDMAVRDAADRGYLVTLVEDACVTRTDERHRAALRAFGGYCFVTSTDDALRRLAAMD